MRMNLELIGALNELEKERGISKEILLEAIETAIVSAYKRNYDANSNSSVRVDINQETGAIHVYSRRKVVEEVEDEALEISLNDAQEIDPNYQLDDIVETEVTPKDFGRIAAQTAKQIVIQRIREAERSIVFYEYANREGDVITGIVRRVEHRNIIVDLGKVEAVLPASEQMPNDNYEPNSRFRFYISEVRQSSKGPQIFLSRTHPGLLKNLFEIEVPEIQSGVVEIKAVAREAGQRSKIAVFSRDENVDPVGACVGNKGMRVQEVVSQLNGEKIDIVEWVPDEAVFIGNALSPAKALYVNLDPNNKTARTVVPDDQLSLAIGKEGQNARLAARLTNWKIDIKSESQAKDDPLFQPLEELEFSQEQEFEEIIEEVVEVQDDQEQDVAEEVAEEVIEDEVAEEIADEQLASSSKGLDEDALAKISNIKKRKSWEERFGSLNLEDIESGTVDKSKTKKKEKEDKEPKVIKDFSMLDLEDFRFNEEK